jgi:hypothetical protein
VPSKETQDLLDRVSRLTRLAEASEANGNARFDDAVDALDDISGRGRHGRNKVDTDDSVWRVLSMIPDAVVAREPQTAGSTFQPDFLVTLDNHKVLVETKAASETLPALTQQLATALDAYRADEALVVVPERSAEDEADVGSLDPRLKVLAMSDLRGFFHNLSQR